jgi:hypothetical protein
MYKGKTKIKGKYKAGKRNGTEMEKGKGKGKMQRKRRRVNGEQAVDKP